MGTSFACEKAEIIVAMVIQNGSLKSPKLKE